MLCSAAAAREPAPRNIDAGSVFEGGGQALAFAGGAAVPSGYYNLCRKGAAICRPSAGQMPTLADGAVRLTRRYAAMLVAVNRQVNAAIRPISDAAHFGVADRWDVAPRAGDCEDYALTKKFRLEQQGWPSGAALIALAVTRRGEQHAVLVVRTDRGDFVLDNLTGDIRPWSPRLYRWTSIQVPGQVWGWSRLQPAGRLVADAGPLPDEVQVAAAPAMLAAAGPVEAPAPGTTGPAAGVARQAVAEDFGRMVKLIGARLAEVAARLGPTWPSSLARAFADRPGEEPAAEAAPPPASAMVKASVEVPAEEPVPMIELSKAEL